MVSRTVTPGCRGGGSLRLDHGVEEIHVGHCDAGRRLPPRVDRPAGGTDHAAQLYELPPVRCTVRDT
eukprot:m.317394 g.317394  ORF g.317394 m.317394 type:complete len:67 (+) comp20284_c0_seq73:1972-2172(+)